MNDERQRSVSVVAAVLVVLGLLEVILGLATKDRTSDGTNDAVTAHLVAAKITSSTATKGAH